MEITLARYLFAEQNQRQPARPQFPAALSGISIPPGPGRRQLNVEDVTGNQKACESLSRATTNKEATLAPAADGATSRPGEVVVHDDISVTAAPSEWPLPAELAPSAMAYQPSWQGRVSGPVPSLFSQPSVTQCLAMRQLQRERLVTR